MGVQTEGSLRLRALCIADEQEAHHAHVELAATDAFDFLLDQRPGELWAAYLDRLEDLRLGRRVAAGRVPATFLVAEVAGRIVGRVSIRHELDAYLREVGGHVGYCVRPQARGHGYAKEMLRQALGVARAIGLHAALVVCDVDNPASAAVIEACGGRLERVTRAPLGDPPMRRSWVST